MKIRESDCRERGFTLVEMLIVVTIIGILAAIAVPSYRDYVIRSKLSEAVTVSAPIKTSVELFASSNGRLPSALGSLSYIDTTPTNYATDHISSIGFSGTAISINLANDPSLGNAAAGNLIYTASISGALVNWTLSSDNIKDKYWPD